MVWLGMVIVLFFSWPTKATVADDLRLGVESLTAGLSRTLRNTDTPDSVIAPEVLDDLRSGGSKPMLNFPYNNHLGILLNRRLVAPVLQSHNAGTVELQQYYVEGLEKIGNRDMDVTYSVDDIASWPVDGVQGLSRTPIIFEYLYRNFELRDHSAGLLVLQRSREPRQSTLHELSFKIVTSQGTHSEARLAKPTNCGLLRLEMQVNYSPMARILKLAPIRMSVLIQGEPVRHAAFVPIAIDRPFHTFLAVVPPPLFSNVFGTGSIPSPVWDGFTIAADAPDWITISPQLLQINLLECVDIRRFVQQN
ncbi:MAG: hypothetical protein ACRD88_13045 [Terriglobia bacterium]